jgi:hypothetical protein
VTPTEDLARRAKILLTDPLLIGAFASVEKDIWQRIKDSELGQQDMRNQLYCMIKALEMVAGALGAHITQQQIESKRGDTLQP